MSVAAMAGESTTTMRTLGIDLATSDSYTGVCEIDWADHGGPARTIVERSRTHHDDELVDLICDVLADDGWVGIDAPFGFPVAFTEAVGSWDGVRTVQTASGEDIVQQRRETVEIEESWTWRVTDRYVAQVLTTQRGCIGGSGTRWVLSSVASMITPTALRCARLLTSVAQRRADNGAPVKPVDRLGADRIVEAYPVAALRLWLESDPTGTAALSSRSKSPGRSERKSYKHSKGARKDLVKAIDAAAGAGALGLTDDSRTILEESDDRIDAMVCALVARLAALGLSVTDVEADVGISSDHVADEGWIHLPDRGDTLKSLF